MIVIGILSPLEPSLFPDYRLRRLVYLAKKILGKRNRFRTIQFFGSLSLIVYHDGVHIGSSFYSGS